MFLFFFFFSVVRCEWLTIMLPQPNGGVVSIRWCAAISASEQTLVQLHACHGRNLLHKQIPIQGNPNVQVQNDMVAIETEEFGEHDGIDPNRREDVVITLNMATMGTGTFEHVYRVAGKQVTNIYHPAAPAAVSSTTSSSILVEDREPEWTPAQGVRPPVVFMFLVFGLLCFAGSIALFLFTRRKKHGMDNWVPKLYDREEQRNADVRVLMSLGRGANPAFEANLVK